MSGRSAEGDPKIRRIRRISCWRRRLGLGRLGSIIEHVRPDCIFHLAGRARGTPAELTHANVGLMQSLLRALRRTKLRPRLIVAGSAAEYGAAIRDGEPIRETAICAPLSAYGASKHAQTRAALAYADATGTSVLVARDLQPSWPEHADASRDRRFCKSDRVHATGIAGRCRSAISTCAAT